MQLGPAEILVVLVIALLVFGPNKLPEVGRQVGSAYRELRKFQRSLSSELSDTFADDVSDGAAPAPALPPKRVAPDDPESGDPETGDAETGDADDGDPDDIDPQSGNAEQAEH